MPVELPRTHVCQPPWHDPVAPRISLRDSTYFPLFVSLDEMHLAVNDSTSFIIEPTLVPPLDRPTEVHSLLPFPLDTLLALSRKFLIHLQLLALLSASNFLGDACGTFY